MALKAKKLNQDDIKKALGVLDGWRTSDDQIGLEKTFQFSDFNAAFGFVASGGCMATETALSGNQKARELR